MTQNKLERFCQRDGLASVLNSDHVDAENRAGDLVRLGHHLAQVVVGSERESDAGVCPGNGRLVCNEISMYVSLLIDMDLRGLWPLDPSAHWSQIRSRGLV